MKHKGKVVIITGAGKPASLADGSAGSIGYGIATAFAKEGADLVITGRNMQKLLDAKQELERLYGIRVLALQADVNAGADNEATVQQVIQETVNTFGRIDVLINNAPPAFRGIDSCTYEEFQQALAVGVTAPFYLSKLFAPYFAPGASILNISSSRMSQPQSESYTAAKGGIAALTHALAVSFAGKVRVNSISPGWIDTAYTVYEGPDAIQQPAGRVGNPLDIAHMALFLASDKAGFITGENICIDGGQTRLMIYHGDHGWSLNPLEESQ